MSGALRGELRRLLLAQYDCMRSASVAMIEPLIGIPDGGTVLALQRLRFELLELEAALAAVLAAIDAAEPAAQAADARDQRRAITRLESLKHTRDEAA